MQTFTDTHYHTSEQHKEIMIPRLSRDHSEALNVVTYLMERSRFDSSDELMNISTGEICNGSVNVHLAKDIGETLIGRMEGLSVFDFSFKRRDTVETMPTKSSIVIDNETIPVDIQLLFQRLMAIAGQSPEELESN